MFLFDRLHREALQCAVCYQRAQADLVRIIRQIQTHRVYLHLGYSSLFRYTIHELGLSEDAAVTLIAIARKSREIPALETMLREGRITLSNAKRICPVMTAENQNVWLEKAASMSARELEKAVITERPQEAVQERAKYVSPQRLKLEIGVEEETYNKLRRAQDLVSQRKRKPVSIEETIEVVLEEYLFRHDPIEKAKRSKKSAASAQKESAAADRLDNARPTPKRSELPSRQRAPIPLSLLHAIHSRDQRQCTFVGPDGERCKETRWVKVHHLKPVSRGGQNTYENLVTLCSAHHQWVHLRKDVN